METNFFSLLQQIAPGCDWTISIKHIGGKISVAMVPNFPKDRDPAMGKIVPFRLTAAAELLDKTLAERLHKPAAAAIELSANNVAFEKSIQQAREASKAEQEKKQQVAKAQAAEKDKFDALIKKVDDLTKDKKYGEAIGLLQKASDLPAYAEKITERLTELRNKHGQLSLL